jgi:hypothetical protein
MALGSYIFDGNTETPDTVARRRKIADALLAQSMQDSQPKSVMAAIGQGIGDLGEVLAYKRISGRADEAEKAGRASVGDLSALFGAGGDAGGNVAATGDGDISTVANPGELSASIQATAQKLGIDPVDLGTAISYETAGTFDPWKAGPTTQWGQHRGLIQWGEPQRAKYGVTADMPIAAQMDAVGKYLTDAGVKPGMGLLDIYSAINAGRVGRYNASDAGNGGAPGTVRDKVLQQMGGHRAKALALLKSMQAQPTQVASLDPSAGMATAYPNTVTDGDVAVPAASPAQPYTSPIQGSDNDPTGISGGPAIAKVAQALQQAQQGQGAAPASLAVQKVAQALTDRSRIALQIMRNPWASPEEKAVAADFLKTAMERNDPIHQLALRKAQLEVEQMEHPRPEYGFSSVGDDLIRTDKNAGTAIPVYQGKPKATGKEQDYEYYAAQEKALGRQPLSFGDWDVRNSKAGSSSVTVNNAGTTELQKLFAKRYDDISTQAQSAPDAIAKLDRMTVLSKDPNFYSGTGAGTVQFFKQALAALGGDPKSAAPMEEFASLSNKAALDVMGGSLGTGFSNADRDFVVATVPALDATPQGNLQRIDVLRRINQRKIEIGKMADDYVMQNGQLDAGFNKLLSQYAETHPLFGDLSGQAGNQPQVPAAPAPPAAAAPAPVGQPKPGSAVDFRKYFGVQ